MTRRGHLDNMKLGTRNRRKPARERRFLPMLEQFEGRVVPSITAPPLPMDAPIAHDDAIDTDGTNPVVVSILANDFSLNSTLNSASVALTSQPTHGIVNLNSATGDATYTAVAGFAGTDRFTYTVRDNNGLVSNAAMVSVVVNRPTANDDFIDTDGTNPVAIDVLANDTDPDGPGKLDPTSVVVTGTPSHGSVSVDSSTGQITYTSVMGFAGSDTFFYTVKDLPGATSNPAKVTVVVNRPTANDDFSDTDGTNSVTVDVLANDTDPDGPGKLDPTSVVVVSSPSHGSVSVNSTNGEITYTSLVGYSGSDTFAYTVKDIPGATSNPGTVTVVIHRPTANDDFIDATATTPVAIDVLANDTDPDGNNQLDPTSVAIVSGPAHGGLSVNSTTGVVTYTAASGFFGTDTFRYTVADIPGAVSNPGEVTVNVGGSVGVVDDSIDTDAGNPVTIDVLANDSSPSGLVASSVKVASGPSHGGTAVDVSTGEIIYTPVQGFAGTDNFTYTVKNGLGIVSSPAHVSVVVNRPTANDDFIDTDAGNPVTVDVLANDSDPDGPGKLDATTVAIANGPSHGNASIDPTTGAITYTSAASFSGTDTIGYTVTDVNGAVSNVATLSVVVNRPTANDDFIDTDAGNSVTVDVLANDTDPDGVGRLDSASVVVVSAAGHGSTTVNPANGQITYTPSAGFSGTELFKYTVTDLAGAVSNQASVTVVVNRPTANDDFTSALGTTPIAIDVLANDTDPDGPDKLDATTVHVLSGPAHGNVSVDPVSGIATYTASAGFSGTDSFGYTVTDVANAVSNPANVTVVVQLGQISGTVFTDFNANGAPSAGEPGLASQTVYIDANHSGKLDAGETTVTTDAGGHYVITGLPAGSYAVRLDTSASPNAKLTSPASGIRTVAIAPNAVAAAGQDFGNAGVSTVSPVQVVATIFPGDSHSVVVTYVEGVYHSILGRDGDAGGISYWANLLSQPGVTRQTVATQLWASTEHRQMEIGSYYQAYLGRTVDAGGMAFWVQAFAHGAQESDVTKAILSSPEFLNAHASNDALVSALYNEILGRGADTGGQAFWTGVLNSGQRTRAQVVAALASSSEAYLQAVDSLYAALLHRGADTGDAYWLSLLTSGHATIFDVGVGFLASGEYFGAAQAHTL